MCRDSTPSTERSRGRATLQKRYEMSDRAPNVVPPIRRVSQEPPSCPHPAAAARTRAISLVLVAVVAAVTLLPGAGASADTAADQRDVKRQRAAVASQIDTLQATDAQLDAALADLQANVTATQAAMNDAEAEVAGGARPRRPGRA